MTPSPPRQRTGRPALVATAALAALSVVATACGGGAAAPAATGPQDIGQAEIDRAMQTPTALTFWTWVPDIEKEVALFEQRYPAIDVEVVNAGQGEPQYTKLRTALQAGTGAPDVAQIEFQYIPTFALTDSLVDLRPYGAEERADEFVDWTWDQVSGADGEVWAYPQDTGPMGMLYRQDIFDQYGITPPRTWEEFAEAARTLHAADPEIYMTNLASNQNGVWMGLLWQAGVRPFDAPAPEAVTVSVNDDRSKEVGAYWQELIQDDVVSTDPDFTDSWFQGLARGKYATWLTAAWGPAFLTGSVAETSGKWRAAPLPQWDADQPASGNWGGSTTAVITGTQNPIAAAEFAEFLNTDPESTRMFATEQLFFPATKALLADPAFAQQAPEFYGGQPVNEVFAQVSETVDSGFQWPPFLDQVVTDWDETVGKSFADRGDVGSALDTWQTRITDYARNQGFTVTTE